MELLFNCDFKVQMLETVAETGQGKALLRHGCGGFRVSGMCVTLSFAGIDSMLLDIELASLTMQRSLPN